MLARVALVPAPAPLLVRGDPPAPLPGHRAASDSYSRYVVPVSHSHDDPAWHRAETMRDQEHCPVRMTRLLQLEYREGEECPSDLVMVPEAEGIVLALRPEAGAAPAPSSARSARDTGHGPLTLGSTITGAPGRRLSDGSQQRRRRTSGGVQLPLCARGAVSARLRADFSPRAGSRGRIGRIQAIRP